MFSLKVSSIIVDSSIAVYSNNCLRRRQSPAITTEDWLSMNFIYYVPSLTTCESTQLERSIILQPAHDAHYDAYLRSFGSCPQARDKRAGNVSCPLDIVVKPMDQRTVRETRVTVAHAGAARNTRPSNQGSYGVLQPAVKNVDLDILLLLRCRKTDSILHIIPTLIDRRAELERTQYRSVQLRSAMSLICIQFNFVDQFVDGETSGLTTSVFRSLTPGWRSAITTYDRPTEDWTTDRSPTDRTTARLTHFHNNPPLFMVNAAFYRSGYRRYTVGTPNTVSNSL